VHKHRIVKLLALLGVLLHAYALVGHNGAMLRASLLQAAQASSELGVICHAFSGSQDATDHSGGSQHDKATASCPLCAGAVSAHALEPPAQFIAAFIAKPIDVAPQREAGLRAPQRFARPPSTGPPAFI
jgi:hypothetical protein